MEVKQNQVQTSKFSYTSCFDHLFVRLCEWNSKEKLKTFPYKRTNKSGQGKTYPKENKLLGLKRGSYKYESIPRRDV